MSSVEHRAAARMTELDTLLAAADAFCAAHGVARNDALRLALVLEELFTNTVKHGHGGDSDAPVVIGLQAEAALLVLHYIDGAPPFDPRERMEHAARQLALPADQRQEGGAGLRLVADLAAALDYAYEQGLNRLRIELPRRA
jgi:serine/threonine-protein kinase RsbW